MPADLRSSLCRAVFEPGQPPDNEVYFAVRPVMPTCRRPFRRPHLTVQRHMRQRTILPVLSWGHAAPAARQRCGSRDTHVPRAPPPGNNSRTDRSAVRTLTNSPVTTRSRRSSRTSRPARFRRTPSNDAAGTAHEGSPASPPQAPRANAICERITGTLRRELFDRLLIVNDHHLRRVLTEYLLHYNTARPHRFLSQLTPAQSDSQPPEPTNLADHRIRQKQVLGGLTCEYYIAALPTPRCHEKRR